MPDLNITLTVRVVSPTTSIIAIMGDLNAFAEDALTEAFAEACTPTTRTIILDFSGLDYMNSGGIGLLVAARIRLQRQGQRLLAFGLSEHDRRIFAMTKLDQIITVCDSEAAAIEAAAS
jgi:anti-sigma B factor antagonist